MKYILKVFGVVTISVALFSCGTMSGLKKNIAVIDAPADLVIINKETGNKLDIKSRKVASTTTTVNSKTDKVTSYYAPAVRVKPKRNLTLELQSGGNIKTVEFGIKRNYGIIALESVLSVGLFGAIDLITGGMNDHKNPYIDVSSVLAGQPQRTNKQLFIYSFKK